MIKCRRYMYLHKHTYMQVAWLMFTLPAQLSQEPAPAYNFSSQILVILFIFIFNYLHSKNNDIRLM